MISRALAFLVLLGGVARGADTFTIRAATILDGKGQVLRNKVLRIRGSKIDSVEPGYTRADFDLGNLTLMPGWIDTHVHISWYFDANGRLAYADRDTILQVASNAYKTLMGGFTTVQSVGAPIDVPVRAAIENGEVSGARILTSIRQTNEKTGTPDQIRAFVRQQIADGADVIKLFATKSIRDGGGQSMTDGQIAAACGQGKRAIVHAHTSAGAKAAVLAGCTAIEHGTTLDDETLRLMAERGTYFDPNFLVLHNYLDKKASFLGIGNYNEEGFAYMEKALPQVADVIRRARALHVKIVFGTDAVAGAHGRNAEEFIYRVKEGGEKPADVLLSATSLAAESLGMSERIGAIAPGMEADLVATDGSPLDDITNVRKVAFIMKSGKIYLYPPERRVRLKLR